ncbi:Peroxisomal targeting signal receptor [Ophiocordyceps camponoti-floridani]|uniref:Peroxisomal targeting signal receptor n=1 Tax=Ophiocordyceps camponoti-floridani TaxID=2030778 RepID=A0A8H4Q4J2_9HYPO|nr:Peroxisomal targeting signal receptor [Ophiocordyceps camponoti-floridani]
MSFLDGAECSSSGNPLSQFQKHVQDDKTLQRDRLVGRGPGGQLGGFRSQAGVGAPQDEMLDGFLNGAPSLQQDFPIHGGPAPQLNAASPLSSMRASSASPSWTRDFNGAESAFKPPAAGAAHFSADEFARFNMMNAQAASSSRSSPMPSQMARQRPMMGVGMMLNRSMGCGMAGPVGTMFQPMHQSQQPVEDVGKGKGKGKLVELDDSQWEEQFAQLELQDKEAAKREATEMEEAAAAERELDEMDRAIHSETNEFGDFESIWKGIQAETAAARSAVDDEAYADLDREWNSDMLQDLNGLGDWGRFSDPVVESYLFEEDNMFRKEGNAFEQGVRVMREGGNLSLAALAFEAAVQQDPNHVEAWVWLGQAQAQNEKETAAIRAMEEALKLDGQQLDALMGLAVSYTNEGYDSTAYRTLERWLSAKYPAILDAQDLHPQSDMGFSDRQQLHDKVTGLFIKAAQLSPDGERMDPDVQVGLGVLFYGAEEYDKAVDCFRAALQSSELGSSNRQQQVHLLWNRLGATLANSGRSEEAIAAYEQALELAPNFVRARYNLGVSCININCHHEAACHFLAALEMHKSIEKAGRRQAHEMLSSASSSPGGAAGGPGTVDEALDRMSAQNRSSTLYDTLRRVFTQMDRRDLAERTVPGVDPDVFRGEFDF